MLELLATLSSFLPQGPGTSSAPVVINEFQYDDAGTDDVEFVELYNRSTLPVDISGWQIVNRDPGSPLYGGGGTDPTHVIPPGTILQPGAFWVLGNTAVLNVNQVFAANGLENDNESIELVDTTNTIVDSVCYEMGIGAFGPHPIEGVGFYGDLAVGNGPTSSIGRRFDGLDNDNNGRDFACTMAATPGTTNNVTTNVLPLLDTFDAGVGGATIPGWQQGFVPPKYVDPTQVSAQNLTAKPASPQGGLAMSTWDNTGGGNSVVLTNQMVADVVVESYVWVEPMMSPVNPAGYTPTVPPVLLDTYNIGDGEWWAMGVRGTVAANGNPPNVGGYFGTISLGVGTRYHTVTGIAWAHFRTPTSSTLWLIDFGNGSSSNNPQNWTVIGGPINIVANQNDGWQRVRLHVQGSKVLGNFGGTYGCDDGTRFSGTTTTMDAGQVYIGYREAVLYNSNGQAGCHPPLFDAFDVHVPTTTQTLIGTGSPTSAGTPTIDADGLAIPGSNSFAFLGGNLKPQGSLGYAFCGLVVGFSSFAPGFPIPGAPPTALGYVLPIQASAIGFADANGNVRFAFPIPCNVGYLGISLVTQIADFDFSLPNALPIGTSRGMEMIVGQ